MRWPYLLLFTWIFWVALGTGITSTALGADLNLFAGDYVHSNNYGLGAIELTLPIIAEVGPFFEWNRSTNTQPQNRSIAGFMGRITTPWLNFFVDTRAGYYWDHGFNLELGTGYRFVGEQVDIIPRAGFSVVTTDGCVPDFNLSIGLAFVL